MLASVSAIASAVLIAFSAPSSPGPLAGDDGITATHAGDDRVVTVEIHKKQRASEINGPSTPTGSPSDDSGSSQTDETTDPCWYEPVPPVANDPRLNGDDPSTGVL